jgi:hypothetical protein
LPGRRGRDDRADPVDLAEAAPHAVGVAADLHPESAASIAPAQRMNREQAAGEEDGGAIGHPLDLAEDVGGHEHGEGPGQ